jgi:hypothetical protein
MGHNKDRWNIEFKVAVKDMTAEQIRDWLLVPGGLNQFDEGVLLEELRCRLNDDYCEACGAEITPSNKPTAQQVLDEYKARGFDRPVEDEEVA